MKRGDIWELAPKPPHNGEPQAMRRCLIVSPDAITEGLRTVMVVPVTDHGREASFRLPIALKEMQGIVLLDQVQTVDKSRLQNRVGQIDNDTLDRALTVLRWIFAA